MSRRSDVMSGVGGMLEKRAMSSRTGSGAVNQSLNMEFQKDQKFLNIDNSYINENMDRVSISTVQQINDMAYYRRGNRWVDSRLVEKERQIQPKKTIEFGSDEFLELAQRLAKENRQGSIALRGDVLLMVDNEPVLVKNSN